MNATTHTERDNTMIYYKPSQKTTRFTFTKHLSNCGEIGYDVSIPCGRVYRKWARWGGDGWGQSMHPDGWYSSRRAAAQALSQKVAQVVNDATAANIH